MESASASFSGGTAFFRGCRACRCGWIASTVSVEAPIFPSDHAAPVAGGGRYDHLLKAVGAPQDVPAVGAAVHTDRLLAAITNGNGGTL